jgi:glycosyltransferase involved in cell wall biosynthesis
MKVLLYHLSPFGLAHGGHQIQIERTRAALQAIGVEAEYLRWYEETQTGEILHFFGRMPTVLLQQAREKGMKVVMADLLAAQSARPGWRLALQTAVVRLTQSLLPPMLSRSFGWDSYRLADACVAVTRREARLMSRIFAVPPEKVHVVPNGVEDAFLNCPAAKRGSWLICVATITEVKRVLHLAEAAVRAKTPVWFIGKPYTESDPYARRFIVYAKAHPEIVRYEGAIPEREKLAQVYREARGFVLLSAWESLSLSALEAAACECPLLLTDLPWARAAFGDKTSYCPLSNSPAITAARLREFYDRAATLPSPPKPATWSEIAVQLKRLYERL